MKETTLPQLLQIVAERSARYLSTIAERRVAPDAASVERLAAFDRPFPEGPSDPAQVLQELDLVGSPGTVATTGGRFFGFVIGGALPAALAANWLAGAWDQNAGMAVTAPSAAKLETVALGWLLEALGLPAACGAGFVTGATMANFTGLAAARHALLAGAGWDVEAQGLFGAPPITVVVGEEVHVSVLKALALLGLGRERVVRVPADGQGRMRPDHLPAFPGPTIVCLQAGNVNTGAFDPMGELCDRAHAAGAWVHVDGAFGLWAAASPRYAHLAAGIERADSWSVDGHKWLNVPQDSGIVFCRYPEAMRGAMAAHAAYLIHGSAREPDEYTPEFSRRARGIEIWAALASLGRSGLADLVERCCAHASRFAEGLSAAGCEILNEVVLNQVMVSFGDAATTRRVIAGIQEDGTCWCGGTVWHDRTAMRISVSSWATTADDVERSLAVILRVARECSARGP